MILLELTLLLVFLYAIFFVSQFYNVVFNDYAPFVSTDKKTINRIISEIDLENKPIIFELGCGWAKFLRAVEKISPELNLTGVENLFSLYLLSKIKLKLVGSRIEIINKDFFNVDLKKADLIYCYLNNPTMEKLGEKFARECKAGTKIISRSFSIPQFTPEKIIRVNNKEMFFYKI